MSKKDNQITGDDSAMAPEPEPPPARVSSSKVEPGSVTPPRAARFGEGKEGRPVRRERGVSGRRAGFFERTGQFLRDVRAELKRVSWPTANEVKNTTVITIIAVIFFAVYLYAVDHAWVFLIEQLTRFGNWITGVA